MWNVLIAIGAALFLLPYAIAVFCALFPAKDAGPPPPSGHGWIAPNKPD